MMHGSFIVRTTGNGVLTAPETFGLVAVPDFVRVVGDACRTGVPPRLVLDLSEVVLFDEPMLTTLIWARRRCIAARGDLCLVVPRSAVAFSAPEITAMREHFQIAEDVAAAQALLDDPDSCRRSSAGA